MQSILPDGRAVVSGINKVKHHVKPKPDANRTGGIEEREAPIHMSNLGVLNPETDKAERLGIVSRVPDGAKKAIRVRVYKSNGKELPVATSVVKT